LTLRGVEKRIVIAFPALAIGRCSTFRRNDDREFCWYPLAGRISDDNDATTSCSNVVAQTLGSPTLQRAIASLFGAARDDGDPAR
jgi:hypothetical protein